MNTQKERNSQPIQSWSGQWLDGRTAEVQQAKVFLQPNLISIFSLGPSGNDELRELATWPLSEIHFETAEGNAIHLTSEKDLLNKGAMLRLNEPDFLKVSGLTAEGRKRTKKILTFGIVTFVLGTASLFLLWAVTPSIAQLVPLSIEEKIGKNLLAELKPRICESGPAQEALDSLVGRLYPENTGLNFRPKIVHDKEINAFALPGGIILIHQGLIQSATSSDELAGVLAHEMQHVIRRHSLNHIIRSSMITLFSQLSGTQNHSSLQILYGLTQLKYSRIDETIADQGAIDMLQRAGISTQGFLDFFRKLESKDKVPAFLSTHPRTRSRAERVESKLVHSEKPALTTEDWEKIRQACENQPH